jgi:hypothetical protein
VRGQSVALGGDDSRLKSQYAEDAGGDHEWLVAAGQRVTERLDCLAVGGGSAGEVAAEREVVLEREVDHAVGGGGGVAQGVEVVDRS